MFPLLIVNTVDGVIGVLVGVKLIVEALIL